MQLELPANLCESHTTYWTILSCGTHTHDGWLMPPRHNYVGSVGQALLWQVCGSKATGRVQPGEQCMSIHGHLDSWLWSLSELKEGVLTVVHWLAGCWLH